MNTTCGVFAGCWARAAKGDTAAAPHMSVMNSRRLMVTPTAQDNGIAATDTSTLKPGCLMSASAAATVPSRSCSSSDARRPKFRELIRPRRNSPSRAPGPRRVAQRFTRATPLRFRFPRTGSMPLSWRW